MPIFTARPSAVTEALLGALLGVTRYKNFKLRPAEVKLRPVRPDCAQSVGEVKLRPAGRSIAPAHNTIIASLGGLAIFSTTYIDA
jgi:hypothetical protein